MTMPGDRLRRLAARWCAAETVERLIDPMVADLQTEYRAAARRGRWHTRTVAWRGYLAFWKALALHCVMRAVEPSPAASSGSLRMLACSLGAFFVMTALMVAPPMIEFNYIGGRTEKLWLMALLVPQALPLSIPMGICVGIVCAMRGRRPTSRHLAAVLLIAAVATFAVWTMLEWGVPAANQEFRETIATRLNNGQHVELEPGLNELGLSRLAQRSDPRAIRAYRLFWSICFATPALAVFALGVSARVRRFMSAVVLSFAIIVLYWFFLTIVDEPVRAGTLSTVVVWLPNIAFLIAGALLLRYGQRLSRQTAESTS
jgi:lipopolysaccharide export LptBFGC system permease protein LptF